MLRFSVLCSIAVSYTHLHVRNNLLGNALANIVAANGNKDVYKRQTHTSVSNIAKTLTNPLFCILLLIYDDYVCNLIFS